MLAREVAWAEALRHKDMETLEELMAPDFRLTLRELSPFALTADEGNPAPGLPGWRWRRNVTGMSFGRIELASIEVIPIAEDFAAVNMRMTLAEWRSESPEGSRDHSGVYDITDFWVARDGVWRAIGRYSRPLDESATSPEPDYVVD